MIVRVLLCGLYGVLAGSYNILIGFLGCYWSVSMVHSVVAVVLEHSGCY